MKEQTKIPVSKVARAAKFVRTGAKVGGNYLKHYTKKALDIETSKDDLHNANATDIYNSLSKLKGSALKVAQMMAMDKNLLPNAYQKQFTMAQYSAPPLSYPLVVKTFRDYFDKHPNDIFDSFTSSAVNAASIGQVHQATMAGKKLAVKIQYPGVGDSINSDLKMVKPFAARLFNISQKDLDHYMGEVSGKLLEETDYKLEVRRSMEISKACSHIDGIVFPEYYPKLSAERVITMDWLEGAHLPEFIKTNPDQETRNALGQKLWDFYQYQMHELKMVHADPHPGNFIITHKNELGIIDFGCVKEVPEEFYDAYFRLLYSKTSSKDELLELFHELEFLYDDDSPEEIGFFFNTFSKVIDLIRRPFTVDKFDFSDNSYFKELFDFGQQLTQAEEIRNSRHGRGSKHTLYLNRTFFGLYNLLNELRAEVVTKSTKDRHVSIKAAMAS